MICPRFRGGGGLIEDGLGRLSAADLVDRYGNDNNRADDDLLNVVCPSHLLASVT